MRFIRLSFDLTGDCLFRATQRICCCNFDRRCCFFQSYTSVFLLFSRFSQRVERGSPRQNWRLGRWKMITFHLPMYVYICRQVRGQRCGWYGVGANFLLQSKRNLILSWDLVPIHVVGLNVCLILIEVRRSFVMIIVRNSSLLCIVAAVVNTKRAWGAT